jgi:hypothetical protein
VVCCVCIQLLELSILRALSRDEDVFPDASRFDPNRHLTIDGQLKDHVVNHFAFGHGRWVTQICYHFKLFTRLVQTYLSW